jgi:ABC-2 type transport system permease protein
MAVYEHGYRPYAGRLTPEWSRFLVIPRYALRDTFKSKLFTGFFLLCFIYPLVAAIIIYLHHNTNALALMKLDVREIIPINASFFETFVWWQGWLAFLLTVLMGPPLVSRDMANNAVPLYLCRPFSRAEYVLGKWSVLFILLSLVTWVPGLVLFFFQAYLEAAARVARDGVSWLEGLGWLWSNFWIAGSIVLGSVAWIVIIGLLALAVSAIVKWRVVASGALLGLFFVPSAFAEIVNNLFLTRAGHLFSPGALIGNVWKGLFGTFVRQTGRIRGRVTDPLRDNQFVDVVLMEPPLWASWLVLALVCLFCLWLLSRKVRAYEVVK